MTIDRDDDEVWIVYRWQDVVAVVDSEQMAELLCIGPDHMTWKRFSVGVEPDEPCDHITPCDECIDDAVEMSKSE